MVELSKAHLSNIENGRRGIPSPDLVYKISSALSVPYTDLLIKASHVTNEDMKRKQETYAVKVNIDSLDRYLRGNRG